MNLFAFYLGGRTETSYIEVHDVRFAIGDDIEGCFDVLRDAWWGQEKSVHIDAYAILDHIDGYDVALRNTPYIGKEKLYFLNLGGYDPNDFSEMHRNIFVVAENESEAKTRALEGIINWHSPHKDSLFEVESVISLNDFAQEHRAHLHLAKVQGIKPLKISVGFISLGDEKIK